MEEYPKLIYNNKDKVCVTVLNEHQDLMLNGYFTDAVDHTLLPYAELHISEAMRIHSDAEKEIKKSNEEAKESLNLSKMKWGDLKSYAKEIGVKLPLKAKRDDIEQLIQEVLNGDSQRSDNESL